MSEPRDLPQHRHIGVLHQRNGHGNDHGKKKETSVSGMVMVRPAVRIRGRASASTLTVRLEKMLQT